MSCVSCKTLLQFIPFFCTKKYITLFFNVFSNLFLIISQNLRAYRYNIFLPSWREIKCCRTFNFISFNSKGLLEFSKVFEDTHFTYIYGSKDIFLLSKISSNGDVPKTSSKTSFFASKKLGCESPSFRKH